VEEQFSSITWDGFSGDVLNSLYITSPISMHCNQSTAELFPVSTTFKPPFHYLRQTGSHSFPTEGNTRPYAYAEFLDSDVYIETFVAIPHVNHPTSWCILIKTEISEEQSEI